MNRFWKIWKAGACVFLRWLWFSFILGLLSLPFRFVFRAGLLDYAKPHSPSMYVPLLVIMGFYILIMPFLLYVASEWTGEFVAPRISRKRLRIIEQGGGRRQDHA